MLGLYEVTRGSQEVNNWQNLKNSEIFTYFNWSPIFSAKTVISYKENSLFAYFSKNTVATGFKLPSNVYQMIIYNFSIDTMLGKSRFLDLTAVNMQKKCF